MFEEEKFGKMVQSLPVPDYEDYLIVSSAGYFIRKERLDKKGRRLPEKITYGNKNGDVICVIGEESYRVSIPNTVFSLFVREFNKKTHMVVLKNQNEGYAIHNLLLVSKFQVYSKARKGSFSEKQKSTLENTRNSLKIKIKSISPNGIESTHDSLLSAEKETGIDSGAISRVINKKLNHYKKWKFIRV